MDVLLRNDSRRDDETTISIAISDSADLPPVRQRVRELLASVPESIVIDAVLVADALANNAHDHGEAPKMVRLTLLAGGGCLRVEADDGSVFSLPEVRGWSGTNGFGMLVISQLAASWGVERHPGHKTVWAEVDLMAPPRQ